jgi:hypothetical protein
MLKLFSVRTVAVLAAAVALFAVVGFAASFAITPSPVINAEGETLVVSCDDEVLVHKIDQWRNTGEAPGGGGFYVKEIQLHNVNQNHCLGIYLTVVLTGEHGEAIGHATVVYNNQAIDFSGQNVSVSDLHDIHVLWSQQPPVGPN